jgi:hypothetical protein
MKGATYRQEKYAAKVKPARLLIDLTALLPGMTSRFTTSAPVLVAMETQVKQTLDAAGVATITYGGYLAFGREIFRLSNSQEISGESLAQIVAVKIAKWVARGLTSSVLMDIRTQVFNVGAPL